MSNARLTIAALLCAAFLAAPATALGAGWAYVESNDPARNTVLVVPYGNNGKLKQGGIRRYSTKGKGAALIPQMSVGTLAGDTEVLLSPDHKLLFAVNQGSDTVAVFRVNRKTGSLKHVKGSPFPSGGKNPISLGYHNKRLVVANHATIAPFAPGPYTSFGQPNLTSFRVSSSGALTKLSSIPTGPGPSAAEISPDGRVIVNPNFYAFLAPTNQTIQTFTLAGNGAMANGSGSPYGLPASVTGNLAQPLPPFLPPGIEKLAFGLEMHPTNPYVYVLATAANRTVTYRYASNGALTFVGQEENPGSFAACWVVITSDGKYLYTANTVSQDVSVFKVSASGDKTTFVQKVKVPSTGTPFNIQVDQTNKFLYVVAGHDDPDGPRPQGVMPDGTIVPAPAPANYLEAFKIGSGGKITSNGTVTLPAARPLLPYGLAVHQKARRK